MISESSGTPDGSFYMESFAPTFLRLLLKVEYLISDTAPQPWGHP